MLFNIFRKYVSLFWIVLILITVIGCKKVIEVGEPVNSVTTSEVFSTDAQANSVFSGIYTQMINKQVFSSGSMTICAGLSSDELMAFGGPGPDSWLFNTNNLQSNTPSVLSQFWGPAYSNIYGANAVIEGLSASNSGALHDSVKRELTGEAKFIRAFCYFYLINLFGDVPLVLTTDFNQTVKMKRTPQIQIYEQIVTDLKDAQNLLASDYSAGLGERIRPNKWTATALLGRVYLYMKDWMNAEIEASNVIGNNLLYNLEDSLSNVFTKNSRESIWQLQQNSAGMFMNGTSDGANFIPRALAANYPSYASDPQYSYIFIPAYYLSSQLINAFEPNDLRMSKWIIDNGNIPFPSGPHYWYAYKYVLGNTLNTPNLVSGGPISQYYMVLRLAEQYLIRAEARAEEGGDKLTGAISDLNKIRTRAGLPNTTATGQSDLLKAIIHERQTELFAEWGHRWLDLKREGLANSILSSITLKQPWSSNSLLYPIPFSEIVANPNLEQNIGY